MMSEDMQKKLYDYEENPPLNTWGKIAVALDEEIHAAFPQKLYQAEVIPPENVWNKIALTLDDVAEEYPSKLYSLEVLPPAGTWQKISSALDQEEALPRISRKGKVAPFVRYAVAACLVGLIAFAVKFLNSSSSNVEHQIPKASSTVPLQPQDKKNSNDQQPAVTTNNLPTPQVILASNNGTLKKYHSVQTGYMTELADVSSENKQVSENDFHQASLQGSVPGSQTFIDNASERYLTLTGPDGYLIRISRKLAETLGCLYTSTDSEEYKSCVEQIKRWRERVAQSPVAPSPLDLIKSMEEKEL